MFIYYFERERERERVVGKGQREGDTESEAGSRLQAVSTKPNIGLEPTNREIMTDEGVWGKLRAKYRLAPPLQGGICVLFLGHSWLPKNKGKGFKCLPW